MTANSHMDVADFFRSPSGRLAALWQSQVHLYRRDAGFQDYFEALPLDTLGSPPATVHRQGAADRLLNWAIRGADRASQLHRRAKIKTDVLFCPNPDFGRKTEVRFFLRALVALAQTEAKILCLLPSDAPSTDELNAHLAAAGRRPGQVEFINPAAPGNGAESILQERMRRLRGRAAFEEAVRILEPHGLNPTREVEAGFIRLAYFIEAWERLAPGLNLTL